MNPWIAGSILLLFFSTRFWGLWSQDLWHDEHFSIQETNRSLAELLHRSLWLNSPPLYQLIIKFTRSLLDFELAPWSLRLPSVFFGLLTLLESIKFAGLLRLGRLTILLATALIIFHPLLMEWQQWARGYSLAVFLTLWQLRSTFQLIEKNDKKNWRVFALSSFLLCLASYFGLLWVSLTLIVMLLDARLRAELISPRFIVIGITFCLVLSPWIRIAASRFLSQEHYWTNNVDQVFYIYQVYRLSGGSWIGLALLGIVLLVLSLQWKSLLQVFKNHRAVFIVCLIVIANVIVLIAKSLLSTSIVVDRYFVHIVTPAILAACAVYSLLKDKKLIRWILTLYVLTIGAAGLRQLQEIKEFIPLSEVIKRELLPPPEKVFVIREYFKYHYDPFEISLSPELRKSTQVMTIGTFTKEKSTHMDCNRSYRVVTELMSHNLVNLRRDLENCHDLMEESVPSSRYMKVSVFHLQPKSGQ